MTAGRVCAGGREVSLDTTLVRGPAVVTFYRGGWCPYCNLQLAACQRALPEIERLGARLIAISPQAPDQTLSTAQKNALTFDVLSDVGNVVARDYRICYELPQELREACLANGKSLPHINGVDGWELPVPATFVIDTDGRIALAAVQIDYRQRLEPDAVIDALLRVRDAAATSK
jgi:peroxiredoxin